MFLHIHYPIKNSVPQKDVVLATPMALENPLLQKDDIQATAKVPLNPLSRKDVLTTANVSTDPLPQNDVLVRAMSGLDELPDIEMGVFKYSEATKLPEMKTVVERDDHDEDDLPYLFFDSEMPNVPAEHRENVVVKEIQIPVHRGQGSRHLKLWS
jgi:hypothetical protein